MEKPSMVIPSLCEGFVLAEKTYTYTRRDVLLYAMGLGLSNNPTDIKDLQFTYENSEYFAPLPSFAAVLIPFNDIFEGLLACPGLPEFNPMMLLHANHKIILHAELPVEATLKHVVKIKNVFDKKNAALVLIEGTSVDVENNQLICTNEILLFIRGIGGFSSKEQSSSSSVPSLEVKSQQTRPPDAIVTVQTNANQALIYRLSGDYNPLHADPNMAAMGGFEKPILHGLCTFGMATRAIIKELLENDASRLLSVSGRFSSPVTPSHALCVEMWQQDKQINFQVLNKNTGKLCITNGVLEVKNKQNSKL